MSKNTSILKTIMLGRLPDGASTHAPIPASMYLCHFVCLDHCADNSTLAHSFSNFRLSLRCWNPRTNQLPVDYIKLKATEI